MKNLTIIRSLVIILLSFIIIQCGTNKKTPIKDPVVTMAVPYKENTNPEPIKVLALEKELEPTKILVGSGMERDIEAKGSIPKKNIVINNVIQTSKKLSVQNHIKDGTIYYIVPDTMKCYMTYTVKVRITKALIISSMSNDLNEVIKETQIPTTDKMEVKLVDPTGSFNIISNNNSIQIIDEDSTTYTEWNWDISPKKSGVNKLKIIVSVLRDGSTKETVYEDSILVKSNAPATINIFLSTYWQWIISTLLLPLFIWWYNNRKKKRISRKA